MVADQINIVIGNWKVFGFGVIIGWILGFITFTTLYIALRVFPSIDGWVSLVKSYTKFLRVDKKKKEKKRKDA